MTTEGCHLCDEALAMLLAMNGLRGWWLDAIDIAESEELMARYAERIPVVRVAPGGAELDWPFTERDVLEWLRTAAKQKGSDPGV